MNDYDDTAALEAADQPKASPDALPKVMTLTLAIACGLSVANVYYAQPLLDAMAREFWLSHSEKPDCMEGSVFIRTF